MTTTRRALLSVTNKEGIVEFAQGLSDLGFEIVSTGGTAGVLRDHSIVVTDVSAVTGFPEILDGRVKTLHPMIHGGVLARRHLERDVEALGTHNITPFEVVAVNLYAFEEAAAKPDMGLEDVLEKIKIAAPRFCAQPPKITVTLFP